jgi:phosphotransferase system  glucose/maltose/N-acetylglucosamine-specific IIC component
MIMPAKKLVRVEPSKEGQAGKPAWKPTPEAKQKATTNRILAAVLWLLAIAGEAFAILYVLKQSTVSLVLLIAAIVVIGVLAIVGDILWKRANRMDPASKSDPVRFFIQNQLGAIIAIVAFLPLIILILLNKNMDAKQKGIAGAIGVVVLLIATYMGISFNPPSVEQYEEETNRVIQLTGQDLVFWTKEGTVYHLCQGASDLQRESKDMTVYSGTVADAHAAGKERLTLKVDEELKQCGYAPAATPSG